MIKTQIASFILTMIVTTASGLELNSASAADVDNKSNEITAMKIAESAEGMGYREVDDIDIYAKTKAEAVEAAEEDEDTTKGALGEVIYNGVHFSNKSDVSVLDELSPLSFKLEDDDNEEKVQQFVGSKLYFLFFYRKQTHYCNPCGRLLLRYVCRLQRLDALQFHQQPHHQQ